MRTTNHAPRLTAVLCGGLIGLAALAAPATADDFYKDKSISIVIASAAGGSYDAYARIIARNMGRYIPGNPTLVPRNMPGAAGMQATHFIYEAAPKDGTALGAPLNTVPMSQLLEPDKVTFNCAELNWIGAVASPANVLATWYTSGIKTIEDAQKKEALIGATTPGTTMEMYPLMANNLFGTKFKVITGYIGGAEINIAMERGEVQGNCAWGWVPMMATKGDWIRDGKLNVIIQTGMKAAPGHSDVPLALDLAKTDEERELMELVFVPLTFARPFAAPPGVPKERVAALRKAFADTTGDRQFLDDADKAQLEIDLVSGEEIDAILARVYKTPQAVIERAKAAMEDPS